MVMRMQNPIDTVDSQLPQMMQDSAGTEVDQGRMIPVAQDVHITRVFENEQMFGNAARLRRLVIGIPDDCFPRAG